MTFVKISKFYVYKHQFIVFNWLLYERHTSTNLLKSPISSYLIAPVIPFPLTSPPFLTHPESFIPSSASHVYYTLTRINK